MKSITEQALNKVNIVGKLLDAVINEGTLKDGRKYLRANITVRVTQTYGGREETSEIPVGMFAAQYTSQNKLNPGYKQLQDLANMKSVQNYGFDNADTVRLNSASLRENTFVTRSGQLVYGWQISTPFIATTNLKEVATFSEDIFVMDMSQETDHEGDETGRLIIKGGLVQYGGRLDVLNFIVENPEAVDYIERNWNINDTVHIDGRIRVTAKEEKTSGASGSWGEDIPETTTKISREFIITTGSDSPMEEEFSYDPSDIKKAFNVRKAGIEQMQLDAKNNVKKEPSNASASNKYSWE